MAKGAAIIREVGQGIGAMYNIASDISRRRLDEERFRQGTAIAQERLGMEQEKLAFEKEKWPYEIEAMQGQAALTQERVKQFQFERQQQEKAQKDYDTIISVAESIGKLGYSPEMNQQLISEMQALGIVDQYGKGKKGDLQKHFKEIFIGKMGEKLSLQARELYSQIYATSKEEYQKAIDSGDLIKNPEKVNKAYQTMRQAEEKLKFHGGLAQKIKDQMEVQGYAKEIISSVGNTFSPDEMVRFQAVVKSPGVKASDIRTEVDNIFKDRKLQAKGTDYKIVADTKSPTGYSYKSVVNPSASMIQGAPAPKTSTQLSLEDRLKIEEVRAKKQKEIEAIRERGRMKRTEARTKFKDQKIAEMWDKFSDEEKKKVLGALADKEISEKNILDAYGSLYTDDDTKKTLAPIVKQILKKAGEKKSETPKTEQGVKSYIDKALGAK